MRLTEILDGIKPKILKESTQVLDEAAVISQYGDTILNYNNGEGRIYRGFNRDVDYILGDGDQLNRRSRSNSNHYTLLLDYILPSWSNFPKRSKSFIGASSYNLAKKYSSNVFIVIPLENQNIGRLSSDDIWYSFPNIPNESGLYINLVEINNRLANLYQREMKESLSDDDPNKLKEQLVRLEKHIQSDKFDIRYYHGHGLIKYFQENGIISGLNDLLDPSKNNITLHKINNLPTEPRHELWLSGKVLMIRDEKYTNIIRKLVETA